MEMLVTRVELHGVAHDDSKYKLLHELLLTAGFSRTILGNDGTTYHMLTAEYSMQSYHTIDTVLNLAQTAANSVTIKNNVFVSQLKWSKWEGLIPA